MTPRLTTTTAREPPKPRLPHTDIALSRDEWSEAYKLNMHMRDYLAMILKDRHKLEHKCG